MGSAAVHAFGVVAAACLLGGMVFFAAILAPLVFTKLDGATAARFIRATFPRYYLYVAVAALLGAVGLIWADRLSGIVLLMVALLTVWLRQGLMPALNRLRDAGLAGDAASNARFDRMHRVSVGVNMVQMLAVLLVVARAGLG
ncbi:MAG: DUF4149 domain-containing protein [Janthinobacterium lividum]